MSDADRDLVADSQGLLQYETPTLRMLGDVRQLTLGTSDGTGDSGNPGAQQF